MIEIQFQQQKRETKSQTVATVAYSPEKQVDSNVTSMSKLMCLLEANRETMCSDGNKPTTSCLGSVRTNCSHRRERNQIKYWRGKEGNWGNMLQQGRQATTWKSVISGFVSMGLGYVLLREPLARQWQLLQPKKGVLRWGGSAKWLPFQGLLRPSRTAPVSWGRESGQTVPLVGGMRETPWQVCWGAVVRTWT